MITKKPYVPTREWFWGTHVKDAMQSRHWLEKAVQYDADNKKNSADLCRKFARSDAERARRMLKEWKVEMSAYLDRPTRSEAEARCDMYKRALERLLLSFPNEIQDGEPIPGWKAKHFINARQEAAKILGANSYGNK